MAPELDPAVDRAVRLGVLGALPPASLQALLTGARRQQRAPGVFGRQAGRTPLTATLLLAGLIRLYVEAPDGRQVTVRYARPGTVLGAVTLFVPDTPLSTQALTDCDVLALDPTHLRTLAQDDGQVAKALLLQIVEYHNEMLRLFTCTTFGTIRRRAAAHLLDLVAAAPPGGPLRTTISQQSLADAVGSTREVVARSLRELRDDGLIATGRRGITVLDPERLAADVAGDPKPLVLASGPRNAGR